MKEITRINLATLPYNVEVEAKKQLEKYLTAVEHSLGADADAMREIESRISELLAERGVTGEKVISGEDVMAIKEQLGEAKDFASEDEEHDLPSTESLSDKPERRLLRDTSRRMLGGVCAGVAAYFNTDVVLVRAIAAILLFVTAGTMVPIYLLLWVIIPPARTAAERLQMAGKPVTLATIKDESDQAVSTSEPAFLTFLRYGLAGVMLIGTLSILGFLALGTIRVLPAVTQWPPQMIAFTVISALSGVFLASLCILLAYSLITKRFTRLMGTILIAIMLLGLACFGTGMFGLRFSAVKYQSSGDPIQNITKTLDAASLKDSKRLLITADQNISIQYLVVPGAAEATMNYPVYHTGDAAPQVAVTKSGDLTTLTAKSTINCGPWCQGAWIDIKGPALDEVTVNSGRFIYAYTSGSIKTLRLSAHNDAKTSIATTVEAFTFGADGSSDIDTTAASITSATGQLSERGSIELGNVQTYEVTVPTACPSQPDLSPTSSYKSAMIIKVNGQPYSSGQALPCLRLTKTDS